MADERKGASTGVETEPFIDIVEPVEVKEVEIPGEDVLKEDMVPEEIDMLKKHEIIKGKPAEGDKTEKKPADKKEEKPDEKKVDWTKELTPEQEQEFAKSASKQDYALYKEMKADRRKRQEAATERDYYKTQTKALQEEIEKLKNKPAEEPEQEAEDDETPMTKKEAAEYVKKLLEEKDNKKKVEQTEQEKKAMAARQRWSTIETDATEKDPNFPKLCDLAGEVIKADKTGLYGEKLAIAALEENPEEGRTAADIIYVIAKQHDRYNEVVNGEKQNKGEGGDDGTDKSKGKIDKILANSKKVSTAQLGSGTRRLLEKDLKLADVKDWDYEQYAKLSPETRERLLREEDQT